MIRTANSVLQNSLRYDPVIRHPPQQPQYPVLAAPQPTRGAYRYTARNLFDAISHAQAQSAYRAHPGPNHRPILVSRPRATVRTILGTARCFHWLTSGLLPGFFVGPGVEIEVDVLPIARTDLPGKAPVQIVARCVVVSWWVNEDVNFRVA